MAESRGDEAKRGMGTTLVIGTIIGNKLFVANIGDSRLYIVGGTEQIRQITRDHSLVDEMVRMGEINADEARVHPDKNIITRAVGAADHVEADFFEVELCEDDRILLCTDGLTNMVKYAILLGKMIISRQQRHSLSPWPMQTVAAIISL